MKRSSVGDTENAMECLMGIVSYLSHNQVQTTSPLILNPSSWTTQGPEKGQHTQFTPFIILIEISLLGAERGQKSKTKIISLYKSEQRSITAVI